MSNQNKYIISIVGSKGGSAKTLTAHILCHGLALRGFSAILATSDPKRKVRDDTNRKYATYAAQDDKSVGELIDHFASVDINVTSFIVFDGGASRLEADVEFTKTSDLTLIPFLTDCEDIETMIDDLAFMSESLSEDDFDKIRLLPSKFPTNHFKIESTNKLLNEMLTDSHNELMLAPVNEVSAAAKLNRPDGEKISSDVNSIARGLADQVLLQLNEYPFQYIIKRKF